MLSILFNWLYMGCLVYLSGALFVQLFGKLVHKEETADFTSIMLAGILFTTCYAQIFSVFYKVAFLANLVLILFLILYVLFQRRYVCSCMGNHINHYKSLSRKAGIGVLGVMVIVIFSFALCSSGPAKLIDTDWYHAQTIRWIEEYGCVKGVANLFYALGFNNAQHYFDALFSMKSFLGQSLRGTGGFFGLLIFIHGFSRLLTFQTRKHHTADALALWEIAYSIIITAFYADPYTDTLPNIIILFILTEWLSQLEEKKENVERLAFLCILGVFATIAKTSAAMVVLLSVYPVYLLIRDKRKKEIITYIGIGFVIAIPYLVTNIITTGYPIYLLTMFDFIPVRWKIDPSVLTYTMDNMIQFARMPQGTIEEALNCGLKWVPGWFQSESISHQILYLSIVLFFVMDMYYIIKEIVTGIRSKKMSDDIWMILPRICIYLGLVYWFFTIPQVKYCWSYLIFPVAVIPVYYLERNRGRQLLTRTMMALAGLLLVLYSGFYGLRTLKYMKDGVLHNPIMQQDYENHVFDTVEKNGHTFYTRIKDGDIVCGYYIFPYLDNAGELDNLVVGEELGDGFYFETN